MEENVSLAKFTTFKIGGPARYFFRAKSLKEAIDAVGFAHAKSLPFFVLGGGSNLLVNDSGFSGVIIKNEILGLSFSEASDSVEVVACAGEAWDPFVAETVRRGLFGLENLSGIPGTVGASPVQNIGAYGVEARETIVSVEALDSKTGRVEIFSNADCQFSYRDSFFKTAEGKRYIITGVRFRLKKDGKVNIGYKDLKQIFNFQFSIFNEEESQRKLKAITLREVRKAVLEIRRGKFPDLNEIGTAGSFFKNPIILEEHFVKLKERYPDLPGFEIEHDTNPQMKTNNTNDTNKKSVKVSLAWIIDNVCKLKGFQKGKVGLFSRQPIVVVNMGDASAEDAHLLAREIADCVKEKTGINIDWEVEKL